MSNQLDIEEELARLDEANGQRDSYFVRNVIMGVLNRLTKQHLVDLKLQIEDTLDERNKNEQSRKYKESIEPKSGIKNESKNL